MFVNAQEVHLQMHRFIVYIGLYSIYKFESIY
jgi:hypothetical protein